MGKEIWIINHYATKMFFNKNGRHYELALNLIKNNFNVKIFCANTAHYSNRDDIKIRKSKLYEKKMLNDVDFVFIKTNHYKKNNFFRFLNMFLFYRNTIRVMKKEISKKDSRPNYIYASSVHPLSLVAGIKISKKFKIPVVCEVRDLWPESLVSIKKIKKNGFIHKILLHLEKWIYKNSDKLIFVDEGAFDYIKLQKWTVTKKNEDIFDKITIINNGVNLQKFSENLQKNEISDCHLDNKKLFKVVYTGTIGYFNRVDMVIDIAKTINDKDVVFLIWGLGPQLEYITSLIKENKLNNVFLKGSIEQKYVPYILSKSDLNIVYGYSYDHYKYGQSMNKLFEYFASGKPVLSTKKYGFSLIERYEAGIEAKKNDSIIDICEYIKFFKNMDKEQYDKYCSNSLKAAKDYDYQVLTRKLIEIIDKM